MSDAGIQNRLDDLNGLLNFFVVARLLFFFYYNEFQCEYSLGVENCGEC